MKTGDKLHREWRAIGCVVGLAVTASAGLYAVLPPSLILLAGAVVVGTVTAIILVRVGWWRWRTALVTLSIVAATLLTVCLVMTRPVAVGTAGASPPFPEIDAYLKDQGFSGAVLVARDGQVLFDKGYGYADRNRMVPNTPQTRFPIGSVTKQFTAMAILMLQEQGRLNLQDHVPQELLDEMFTAHIPTPEKLGTSELGYGYGWAVGSWAGHRMQMHGGFIFGFKSMVARFPDDRLTVVVLSNQQNYAGGSISIGVLQEILE